MDFSSECVLTMHRGDTVSTYFLINLGTKLEPEKYILQPGDNLYLSICEPNQLFEHGLIRKIFTYEDVDEFGLVNIKLDPSDTHYVLSGRYYIEMKLKLANGDVKTVYPKRKLYIYD